MLLETRVHILFAGPPLKMGERVSRITPVTRAPLEALLSSLNLGVQSGIDPDAENLVAVATFSYTAPGGQPQQARRFPPSFKSELETEAKEL